MQKKSFQNFYMGHLNEVLGVASSTSTRGFWYFAPRTLFARHVVFTSVTFFPVITEGQGRVLCTLSSFSEKRTFFFLLLLSTPWCLPSGFWEKIKEICVCRVLFLRASQCVAPHMFAKFWHICISCLAPMRRNSWMFWSGLTVKYLIFNCPYICLFLGAEKQREPIIFLFFAPGAKFSTGAKYFF